MHRILLILLMLFTVSSSMCWAKVLPPAVAEDQPVPGVRKPIVLPHQHTEQCRLTKAEPVQIICILDRSGSMRHLAEDTIGGYNSFLAKQRQEKGAAEVTTVLFDDKYDKIVEAADIKTVPELTAKEYYARGMTALLDAVGRTVMDTVNRMDKDGVCPARRRVLFLIMTDGKENDSKEYSKADIKSMIETAAKEYNWNFIFMGANIDSVSEAQSIGIGADHAIDYDHNSSGVRQSFLRMDAAVTEMRETGSVGDNWKKAE
ncbi:hypothetical protein SAMN05216582_11261 [Selenomonas ruminantium]|uniref:von Willebrand factor type A domain-containing protein n=1 Tax=Selenomonas ruminantium TaxID=971 RepID=A0A1M6UGP4_SELRU|nr:vWA domain-containing protein [Selenomonas ruminantium]SHK68402.1 hypothetical protein SAMN05216582_11261 [Selenomonas ruminantium]